MALTDIVGSDSVKDALKTKCNAAFDQSDTTKTEVENARDGETNLLTQIDQLQASITALMAGSGCPVSANDASAGYLNGKLVAGNFISLTEGNDGGDETLTIAAQASPIQIQVFS